MKRRKPINRVSPRKVAYNEELAAITPAIIARAGGLCEVCRVATINHVHHRKRRSQGGPNTMANLMGVCDFDHRMIHANPQWSYERGFLIRRTDEITSLDSNNY